MLLLPPSPCLSPSPHPPCPLPSPRPTTVGYSDPFLDTPAMDGLASSGVKFSTMYTWDWCAPSRGSLLSGRYAPNHGYEAGGDGPAKGTVGGLPTEFELLPAVLSKLGYATSMVGKVRPETYARRPPVRRIDEPLC